jgi:excisionase family DNA binding protein
MDAQIPTMLKVAELAEYLRIHESTVYRLVKAKKIPFFRAGRDYRFSKESIDHWRLEQERGKGSQ